MCDEQNLDETLSFFQKDNLHDLALIVESKELWVPRQALALYSPVFNEMLFGQFKESRENQVHLPEKKFEDILELISCLFPCPSTKKVNAANVDRLLSLSDEYDVYDLRRRCEDFLSQQLNDNASLNETKLLDLLVLACKHKLLSVVKSCMPRAALLSLNEIKSRKELPQRAVTVLYELKLNLVEKREKSQHKWSGTVNGPNPIFCESCGSRIAKTCQRCRQFVCQSCATSESRLTSCPICPTCGNYFPLVSISSSPSSSNGTCKCALNFDDDAARKVVGRC